MGGGISAMNMAYEVMYGYDEEAGNLEDVVEHCVYEKGEELGGTWVVNTYPGVACDVPAHIYTCEWISFFEYGATLWYGHDRNP